MLLTFIWEGSLKVMGNGGIDRIMMTFFFYGYEPGLLLQNAYQFVISHVHLETLTGATEPGGVSQNVSPLYLYHSTCHSLMGAQIAAATLAPHLYGVFSSSTQAVFSLGV